jgi:hypothetical protein
VRALHLAKQVSRRRRVVVFLGAGGRFSDRPLVGRRIRDAERFERGLLAREKGHLGAGGEDDGWLGRGHGLGGAACREGEEEKEGSGESHANPIGHSEVDVAWKSSPDKKSSRFAREDGKPEVGESFYLQ